MPQDILLEIFPVELRRKLRSIASPNKQLLQRLEILEASGPEPTDPIWQERLSHWRKRKAAWETYLTAALAIGLFKGSQGRDLRARLRSPDEENFRSAMAECMAAWFLAGRLGLGLDSRPQGRKGRPLEFLIRLSDGDIYAEVKAPFREIVENVWWGDDSDLLQKAMKSANKQFQSDARNLLIIVPRLRLNVFSFRGQLTHAFFGDLVTRIPINKRTGEQAGPIRTAFQPSGHFLNPRLPSGKPYKLNGTPRFTRVSAVLCIEETVGEKQIEHEALVVHNPNAALRIPEDLWASIPQFVPRGAEMIWTDGADPLR
jgi:hypothetical protein